MDARVPDDLVARFVSQYAKINLHSYSGNLDFVVSVIEIGWLADSSDPSVAMHIESLRNYLEGEGQAENDSFLLSVALAVPGMHRGIVPPLLVLDENRGGLSTKRLNEAAGQLTRLREAIEFGKWFWPSLASDTRTAILQLADLTRTFAVNEPEFRDTLDFIRQLPQASVDEVIERALAALNGPVESIREVGINLLRDLSCFRDSPLPANVCQMLIDHGILWPSCLFRGATNEIAARLVDAIDETRGQVTLNHLLMALTWTHSDVATTAFREWRKHSPPWASKLCVPPSEYLTCAGWCLDEHDHPRDLYSQQCFLLVNKEEDAAPLIRAHVEADGSCSSCNTRLYWLFDFSQSALDFELIGHVEAPRKVLACLHCAAYGPVYAKYSPAGSSELILAAEAGDPDEVWDFSGKARALSYLNIPTFAAADTLTLGDATTLGGLPMWHQDAEYPRCIECGNYMKFLAQHDDSALGQEGIYYAFYCGNCRVSAVTYQQT